MFTPGDVVDGRYTIEGEIGRGGTATVYRARDVKHGRTVALKTLRRDIASMLGTDRFLREIQLAATLAHPNIVPLFDSGGGDGILYYTMPCLAGESLRDRMDRDRQLDVDAALSIVREVAEALSYAHRHGVIHRDVKPENILLFEGRVTVTDFGIARALAAAGDTRLTQTGVVVGSPAYMSPEQAAGDEMVDARSDVYSLACVLYEMLAGALPFSGDSVGATIAKRFRDLPPDVREYRPEIPESLAATLMRAMSIDPDARFHDAADFSAALAAESARTDSAPARTIAVLPFVNVGADPDNEYFSDGLTEELIADLSRIRSLRVTSRTSVMRMKGERGDLRAIARTLGVRYVLEGSVRRSTSEIRITAQLIDAAIDATLWSEKFTETSGEIFNLQERISRDIVRALGLTLSIAEDRQLAARPIADDRVLECYFRARHEFTRMSSDALGRAEALLKHGLEMAPGNPLLETALGTAEVLRAKTSAGYDEALLSQAETRARRAVALAPDLPQAVFLAGFVAFERGELVTASQSLSRAMDLDPNYAEPVHWLALTYFYAGRIERALELAERLVTLDPLNAQSMSLRAVADWPTGQFERSASYSRRAIEIDTGNFMGRWIHGYTLALGGEFAAAQVESDLLAAASPDSPYTLQLSGLLHGLAGRKREADAALVALDRLRLDHHESFHAAESHAAAGNIDRALSLIERGIDRGFFPLDFIRTVNPLLEPVRSHPDFNRVVALAERRWNQFSSA
jgi:serine/threonine protein kinase/tetratricopeptide (TPR) repeat protein